MTQTATRRRSLAYAVNYNPWCHPLNEHRVMTQSSSKLNTFLHISARTSSIRKLLT